jgi:polyribonucleotide 5'-hydroxyl-kinase
VPHGSTLVVKLLSGTAERDGIELPLRNAYTISGARTKILTWHGCELEAEGRTEDDAVARYATPVANPANAHVNLHAQLNELRTQAARQRREGPRVLVAGPSCAGRTTLVRTLASYATRQGYQPLVVNVDPSEGMLSLPGTLTAGVFATVMDPQAADAWGSTPTSGPSSVPVKLPLVMYYGRRTPTNDAEMYKRLTSRLADATSGRLSEDPDVKTAGVIVDSAAVSETSKEGMDLLAHVVEEFSGKIFQHSMKSSLSWLAAGCGGLACKS